MKERKFILEAAVLLIAALFLLPTGAVAVNKNNATPTTPHTASVLWDNGMGVHGSFGGMIVASAGSDRSAHPADDFMFNADTQIDHVKWEGGYFMNEQAQGDMDYNWSWRITFWNDVGDGSHPGEEIYNWTIANADITRDFWYIFIRNDTSPPRHYWAAHYEAALPQTAHFDANVKYWISINGVGEYPPQAGWSRHNGTAGGILLHEAVFEGTYWGYPDWVGLSTMVPDLIPHDLNFQLLFGTADTTPPETHCMLAGNQSGGVYITPVTVTLTATDDDSGVANTYYNLDSAGWTPYAGAFTVSAEGSHMLQFYSVDNAANVEPTQTVNFTIQFPIQLTITKGLGFTINVKNTLATDQTNVPWDYSITGGIILSGATNSGSITTVAAGATKKIHAFPIGFGSVTITAHVGGTTGTGAGFLIIIITL